MLQMEADRYGVYHAGFDCWQAVFGFNDVYDKVFNRATSMDSAKFEFTSTSDGKNYMLWAWKGDYLNLGAGAELGIYYDSIIPGHWGVDKDLAMEMPLELEYTNPKTARKITLFTYKPGKPQWWITGFKPSVRIAHENDLTANYSVTFNNNTMFTDFYNKYGNKDSRYFDKRWTFDLKSQTATFKF